MRAVLKTVPLILLCWPTTSEANGGGIAVELEPSHQFLLHFAAVWHGSRGAIWHNEAKMWHLIPQVKQYWLMKWHCYSSINPYSILAVLTFWLPFSYSCTESTEEQQRFLQLQVPPYSMNTGNAASNWETDVQMSPNCCCLVQSTHYHIARHWSWVMVFSVMVSSQPARSGDWAVVSIFLIWILSKICRGCYFLTCIINNRVDKRILSLWWSPSGLCVRHASPGFNTNLGCCCKDVLSPPRPLTQEGPGHWVPAVLLCSAPSRRGEGQQNFSLKVMTHKRSRMRRQELQSCIS